MKYLLDTNICIHWLRGQFSIAETVDAHGLENCFISEITKAELLYGQRIAMRKGVKVDQGGLEKFLDAVRTVPVSDALELYAAEKDRLCSAGTPLEDFDLLIGCTAITGGYILVSENVSHMSRLSGMRLENWSSR